MVNVTVERDKLVLELKGVDKLWSLKSRLELPLSHIQSVKAAPEISFDWWKGIRWPGTALPGVLKAGTFFQDGKRIFWDARPENKDKIIVIDLKNDDYDELIIEVADPRETTERVLAVL